LTPLPTIVVGVAGWAHASPRPTVELLTAATALWAAGHLRSPKARVRVVPDEHPLTQAVANLEVLASREAAGAVELDASRFPSPERAGIQDPQPGTNREPGPIPHRDTPQLDAGRIPDHEIAGAGDLAVVVHVLHAHEASVEDVDAGPHVPDRRVADQQDAVLVTWIPLW
jgi:hypothetical protein